MKRGRSSFVDDDDNDDVLYFSFDNVGSFCGYIDDDFTDDKIAAGFLLC